MIEGHIVLESSQELSKAVMYVGCQILADDQMVPQSFSISKMDDLTRNLLDDRPVWPVIL